MTPYRIKTSGKVFEIVTPYQMKCNNFMGDLQSQLAEELEDPKWEYEVKKMLEKTDSDYSGPAHKWLSVTEKFKKGAK